MQFFILFYKFMIIFYMIFVMLIYSYFTDLDEHMFSKNWKIKSENQKVFFSLYFRKNLLLIPVQVMIFLRIYLNFISIVIGKYR